MNDRIIAVFVDGPLKGERRAVSSNTVVVPFLPPTRAAMVKDASPEIAIYSLEYKIGRPLARTPGALYDRAYEFNLASISPSASTRLRDEIRKEVRKELDTNREDHIRSLEGVIADYAKRMANAESALNTRAA